MNTTSPNKDREELIKTKFNVVNELFVALTSVSLRRPPRARNINYEFNNTIPGSLNSNGQFHWKGPHGKKHSAPVDKLEPSLDTTIVELQVLCYREHERRLHDHPAADLRRALPGALKKIGVIDTALQHLQGTGIPNRSDGWMANESLAPLAERVFARMREIKARELTAPSRT